MAGNPKSRARKAAAAAEAAAQIAHEAAVRSMQHADVEPIGQSVAQGAPAPAHAHAPAPARERTPRPRALVSHAHEGSAARTHFERREADDYAELTAQLSAGVTVRILRTRPSWAAGWIEDLELDSGDASELFELLRSEHGGQVYSVQIIGRDNRILYKAKVPIAGPVRREGRPVTREQWEGIEAARTTPNPRAEAAAGSFEPMSMLRLFLDMQKDSSSQITEAIREMQRLQTKQTEQLIGAVMQQRSDERTGSSLATQLREVVAVTQQVDEIRNAMVESAPRPQQSEPIDPIRQATADIFKTAIQNEMGKRNRPPPQQQPGRPRPAGPRRAPPPQTNGRRAPNVEPLHRAQPGKETVQ